MSKLGIDGLMWVLPAALALSGVACDLGSKSVSGTADEAGDDVADDGGDATTSGGDGVAEEGDDGATSQGPGEGGDEGGGPGVIPVCIETTMVLGSTSEVSPIGISADDLIMNFDGWSMDFAWLPNDGPMELEPAGTNTQLDIGLTPGGGEVRFIDSEANPDSPLEIDPDCQDRLEIDVDVEFATADGRFDESFTAIGSAGAEGILQISQDFEPDGLSGSFSDADVTFTSGMGEVRAFNIQVSLADEAPTGSVNMEVLLQIGDNPDEAAVGFGIIAAFPSLPE